MKSRFEHLHQQAISLRKSGCSIGEVERRLGIPRSTLSGWFRDILLTKIQVEKLEKRSREGLVLARTKASDWHRAKKAERIAAAEHGSKQLVKRVSRSDDALEVALAFLYLGEGAKTGSRTALGSSDVRIARFFVKSVQRLYGVPTDRFRCNLHLRSDQDSNEMKRFWSRALDLPLNNFGTSSIDKRTAGRATYHHYKGVCLINCSRVDIQRRLLYIASGFCDLHSQN